MTVNKQRVQRLVEALESGEYQQAQGRLARTDNLGTSYCCLGVATLLALQEQPDLVVYEQCEVLNCPVENHHSSVTPTSWHSAGSLPPAVRDFYGFESRDPLLYLTEEQRGRPVTGPLSCSASGCNDSLKLTFPEIAAAFRNTFLRDEEPSDGGE